MIYDFQINPIIVLLKLIIYRTLNDQFGVSRQALMQKSPESPLEAYN